MSSNFTKRLKQQFKKTARTAAQVKQEHDQNAYELGRVTYMQGLYQEQSEKLRAAIRALNDEYEGLVKAEAQAAATAAPKPANSNPEEAVKN